MPHSKAEKFGSPGGNTLHPLWHYKTVGHEPRPPGGEWRGEHTVWEAYGNRRLPLTFFCHCPNLFFFLLLLLVPFFIVLLCCILPRSSAYSVTRLHHMIYCSLSFKTSHETHAAKFTSKVLFDHCPPPEVALGSQLLPWNIHCKKCLTEIVTFFINNVIFSGNTLFCFICSTFLLTSECVLCQSSEVTKYIYTRFKVRHVCNSACWPLLL